MNQYCIYHYYTLNYSQHLPNTKHFHRYLLQFNANERISNHPPYDYQMQNNNFRKTSLTKTFDSRIL